MMDRPVQTFAVGFAGEDSSSPTPGAWPRSAAPNTTSSRCRSRATPTTMSRLAWHLDEPLADLSSLGFLALSELASRHVTVALSGQGADELFGGYRKHRVASLAQHWGHLPRPLRTATAAAMRRGPGRAARLAEALQSQSPVARLLASSGLVHHDLRGDLFGGALAEHSDAAERIVAGHLRDAPGAAPLEAALYLDARLGLVDDMLSYFDRASMACSLEVRVPFLDHEYVELCARVPTEVKVRRLQGKHVLREAARGLVPDFVLQKRKRGFFNESVGTWLSAHDGEVVDRVLLSDSPAYEQVLDRGVVQQAVSSWRGGNVRQAPFLLSLVMLELWLGDYLPRAFALADGPVRSAA